MRRERKGPRRSGKESTPLARNKPHLEFGWATPSCHAILSRATTTTTRDRVTGTGRARAGRCRDDGHTHGQRVGERADEPLAEVGLVRVRVCNDGDGDDEARRRRHDDAMTTTKRNDDRTTHNDEERNDEAQRRHRSAVTRRRNPPPTPDRNAPKFQRSTKATTSNKIEHESERERARVVACERRSLRRTRPAAPSCGMLCSSSSILLRFIFDSSPREQMRYLLLLVSRFSLLILCVDPSFSLPRREGTRRSGPCARSSAGSQS